IPQALGPQSVRAAAVALRDFRPTLTSTGTLVPERQLEMKALVEGRIESLPVDIGARVPQGSVVFEIRTADYRNAEQQPEAAVARARVVLQDRQREKVRMEGLFKEGSATEQMRDQASTAAEETQATLRESEARLAIARQALEDATARAPYPAVVTAR